MFSFSQSFPLLIFRCGCVIALFIINHFGILKGSINESLPRCVALVKDDITIEFVIRKKMKAIISSISFTRLFFFYNINNRSVVRQIKSNRHLELTCKSNLFSWCR